MGFYRKHWTIVCEVPGCPKGTARSRRTKHAARIAAEEMGWEVVDKLMRCPTHARQALTNTLASVIIDP